MHHSLYQKFISPASFSRALGYLVSMGTLSASEAIKYRSGFVPDNFELLLPHGGVMAHSPKGYFIWTSSSNFQAVVDWALA